ncbi:hypothetical protein B0H13DRAFT_2318866 [Mycena leptocephala]|nr:hypothetical protein B0H13DRAFT_2318866 [Mycena leptocephala]
MPPVRTANEVKQWRRTKARSSAHGTNCFGSAARVSRAASRHCSHVKENIPTPSSSSSLPTSPYTQTSGRSSPFKPSAEVFRALENRSDTYEEKHRNLTRRMYRTANTELEKRVHDIQQKLRGLEKSSSQSHRKGGRDSRVFEKLLTRPKMLPLLFQFIGRSGLFRTVFGDLPDVTLPENSARRAWEFRDVYTVEAYEVATFTSVA